MKKLILIVSLFIIAINSYSQEFMGIKVEGTKKELIDKFEQKNFQVIDTEGKYLVMHGKAGSANVKLYIFFTPVSKLAWQFGVYLPEETNWYNLKSQFEEYTSLFIEKYGEPSSIYRFFESPYKEGDGYEMLGVELDKCVYAAFWKDTYKIKITKLKQLVIVYTNSTIEAINKKENKEIQSKTF